jgi:hypothetical protein
MQFLGYSPHMLMQVDFDGLQRLCFLCVSIEAEGAIII